MENRTTAPLAGDGTLEVFAVRLVARVEGDEVGRHVLAQGRVTVGSDELNELIIRHPTVSRRHAEIALRPGGVLVIDLGSRNGTRYQASMVKEVMVPVGASLWLGAAELCVEDARREGSAHLAGLSSSAPAMVGVLDELRRVAESDITVLLEGETGTGKEIVARAVHDASPRAQAAFEVVDCAAFQRDLAGAELFGHARGAFTGADRDRAGAFERAHGGTLFLDEVGEIPLELQPMLLRALEARTVRRIGDGTWRRVDVRIVAATNRDLKVEVSARRFRSDLYHRLAVARVKLPALRERAEDIPAIARDLLEAIGPGGGRVALSAEAVQALQAYSWPGNIRELRNMLERAVALSRTRSIGPDALSLEEEPGGTGGEPQGGYQQARERAMEAFERDYIVHILRQAGGNVSRAARAAGIDRAYLHRLMKKHRLSAGDL